MTPADIAKAILEANFEDDFDPVDYVKFGGNESAIEIYNGPLVRIIQPLTVYTLNDHFYQGVDWDDKTFQTLLQNGPIYVIDNKEGEGDEMAAVQPNTQKCWNATGQERPWSDLPEMISAKGDAERKNWLDAQQGLATFFMSQIAKKKQVGQYVKALSLIGRNDLAVNYARYLGRAKLPFGKTVDAILAMKKAGKRSRNRIARLMKSQRDVKWGERGFWLLYNDWTDLAKFFEKDRQHDYQKVAAQVFSGEASDWFDDNNTKPEEMWDSLNDRSLHMIKHLLINRTVYNTDGEEHLVTKEDIAELTDDEIKDIVCERGNKSDSTEDIYDAIRYAASAAYRDSMEGAYYSGYQSALMKLYNLQEDKTIKWIKVDGKEKLGLWFPYSTLEEWINQWKEDEYEDDFYGDIHDLADAYLEKVQPNTEYYGNIDDSFFNEEVQHHLGELEMAVPDNSDPNQPELPMTGESPPVHPEIPSTTTVAIGNNYLDQQKRQYKGVDSDEAHKYHKAMGGKIGDEEIHLRAEAFLAIPFSRIDESASDVKIEFTASEEAAESVVPLLKELQKMGRQGSSRNIKIEDWDGKSSFGFDGDGASKIGDITVAGKVIEALVNGDDEDPKEFLSRNSDISLPDTDEVDYDVDPMEEHIDFHGHFNSDEPELDRQNEEWIESELEKGNLWAWCTARVRATWTDPITDETFHGYAYLGGCSYKNEEDFCHPQGYYPQMKREAYDDLIQNIEKRQSNLGESQVLQEAVYKYATTQIDMPKGIAQHIIQWGELNIADADLYIDEKDGCGRETEQHVTVLYGLLAQQPPEELRQIVIHTKPFLIELAGISIFENEKYDVVKINVISEELSNLHYELRRSCPNENKYPDYKPHVTIAYVKKGLGKKYEGMDVFKAATQPRDFWAYELKFKGAGDSESAERVVELIPFDKSKDFEPTKEPEAGEARYPEAVGESEDPKDFIDDMRYRLKRGNEYFWRGGGQAGWTTDPISATPLGIEDAQRIVDGIVRTTPGAAPGDFATEPINENEDPKDFINANSAHACPECKSRNLTAPDEEGLIDCMDCGIWFDPMHPNNLGESEDPKDFLAAYHVRIRCGRGAQTKYLYQAPNGFSYTWTPDMDNATVFDQDRANEIIGNLFPGGKYVNEPVATEVVESADIDPKDFALSTTPHHDLQHWNEAGPEGGYKCSCGQWSYVLTGWSSSIPNAMRDFRRHKRIAAKAAKVQPQQESLAGPFEDDGLPGEVTSFLRKVRSKRPKQPVAKPVI